jgi:hypothetical protein
MVLPSSHNRAPLTLACMRPWRCFLCGVVVGLNEQAVLADGDGLHHGTLRELRSRPVSGPVYHNHCHAVHGLRGRDEAEQARLDLKRAGWLMG